MQIIRTTLLAAAIASGCASALAAEEQATIPFISVGQSIYSFQADGKMALWIEDARHQWYYAKLQVPCDGLEFAETLGFQPRTMNTLDRFATVVVPRGSRCPMSSLVKSSAPPDLKKNKKAAEATK